MNKKTKVANTLVPNSSVLLFFLKEVCITVLHKRIQINLSIYYDESSNLINRTFTDFSRFSIIIDNAMYNITLVLSVSLRSTAVCYNQIYVIL